jgi:signal peptidase II
MLAMDATDVLASACIIYQNRQYALVNLVCYGLRELRKYDTIPLPDYSQGKKEISIVSIKRARIYDAVAVFTIIVVIALDQWTKYLIVRNLTLYEEVPFPVLGHYLALFSTRNSGAAFSMFNNGNLLLAVLIVVAIAVVVYLYVRMLNTGPLAYKIVFGMIIGGAIGNLLDRAFRGGSVVDFISFRIPELHYSFAIFNIADACISVGVFLLFVMVVFGVGFRAKPEENEPKQSSQQASSTTSVNNNTLPSAEHDG